MQGCIPLVYRSWSRANFCSAQVAVILTAFLPVKIIARRFLFRDIGIRTSNGNGQQMMEGNRDPPNRVSVNCPGSRFRSKAEPII
jgi:hypothetical protein